jgi:uncharacterized RDD family membrane protein YckC
MSTINFESSQYVSVEFALASAGQRLLAAFLDMVIFIIYFIVMVAFFGEAMIFSANTYADFFWLLLIKVPWILYNPLCEYFMHGQTVGKYIVGIRVTTINGERPKLKEVFTRWMFKGDFLWVSTNFLVIIWFVMGIVSITIIGFSKYRQRMADMLANTIVIKIKNTDLYTLKDVLSLKDSMTHEVLYPQVSRFTDDDMMLIKNTILRLRKNPSPATIQFGKELCDETARLMGLEPISSKRMEFLEQVLQDYVVLTR